MSKSKEAFHDKTVRFRNFVWQHNEIRFDARASDLRKRGGEFQIDSMNSVEDTKGNNGKRGFLIITNLRLIWASHKNASVNLSIGLNNIQSMSVKKTNSKLRGNVQGLYLMTKYNGTRFEFIFTSLVKASPRLFTTSVAVYKAFKSTTLYRELKLRGSIIKDKKLVLLPNERVISILDGIWNLSPEQGNLGTLVITDIRVVWYATLANNFNVSIPYMQMRSLSVRKSPKFDRALVVETRKEAGGYILGFRIDPSSRLMDTFTEIQKLHKIYNRKPNFGVEFYVEDEPSDMKIKHHIEDSVDIVDIDDNLHTLAAYYADAAKSGDRLPCLNSTLGLAMEELPPGYSIESLWSLYGT
eukprot:g2907.t1